MPQLRLLGHDVELFCLRPGPVDRGSDAKASSSTRRLRTSATTTTSSTLSTLSTALAARARLPHAPIVFVSHSWFLPIEDPPPEVAPGALIALNDRAEKRLRASVVGEMVPVHRLTQPVAVTLDVGRVPIRRRPRRAVVVSRNLTTRLPPLTRGMPSTGHRARCDGNGRPRSGQSGAGDDAGRHIVFASGRAVLEAMSLARAACVYDEPGVGGWVTADSTRRSKPMGSRRPRSGAIRRWSRCSRSITRHSAGALGRSLATDRHAAAVHAVELVNIYRRAVPAWGAAAGGRAEAAGGADPGAVRDPSAGPHHPVAPRRGGASHRPDLPKSSTRSGGPRRGASPPPCGGCGVARGRTRRVRVLASQPSSGRTLPHGPHPHHAPSRPDPQSPPGARIPATPPVKR